MATNDKQEKQIADLHQMELESQHWQTQQDYLKLAHEAIEVHRRENERHWRYMRYYWIVIAFVAMFAVYSKWN